MYNVLWIDDQYNDDSMLPFQIQAENKGLKLEGYTSFEEGFEVLENNLEKFDLILLDGLFFEKKNQETGTEDVKGIGLAIAKVNELKSKKVFPWFVLSGKDKFTKGENALLEANRVRCFDKTKRNDVLDLFEEMKQAASQQPDIQLKTKYAKILETCTEQFLGADYYSRLFTIIRQIEDVKKINNTEDLFTPIRKIVERMFKKMGEQGVIPSDILSNNGWINRSSLFLAGKHTEYTHLTKFIHPLISESIYRLLNITHDSSHGDGNLYLRVDEFLKTTQSDYLYRSCVYLLFEILLWFNDFMRNNPDPERNKLKWERKESSDETESNAKFVSGKVISIRVNDKRKKYAFFKSESMDENVYIPPHLVTNHSLKEGIPLQVEIEEYTDNRTNELKTRVKRIKQ